MEKAEELRAKGASAREGEQNDDLFWAFTKMVDISKFFRAYCYRSVVEQGFSLNEIDVLVSLRRHPERNTVKGISETMHLSKGMISQAVESLRKKKMVTVNTDEHDRRSVLIHLSTMAHPVLEKLWEASNGFVQRIVSGIPMEQLGEIPKVVTRFYQNKEAMRSLSTADEEQNLTGGAREATEEDAKP